MEQRGRNQWQPLANGKAEETAQIGETVAVGCDRLPIGAHGKEGVDGSSPSEGFAKCLQMEIWCAGPLMGMGVRVPAQRFHPLEDRFGNIGRRRVEGG